MLVKLGRRHQRRLVHPNHPSGQAALVPVSELGRRQTVADNLEHPHQPRLQRPQRPVQLTVRLFPQNQAGAQTDRGAYGQGDDQPGQH